jgi:hypothetical protein
VPRQPPPIIAHISPQVHILFLFDLAGVKALRETVCMDSRVIDRFVIRPAAKGFRIVDVTSGETVVLAMAAQDRMSEVDAAHTAKMLNERAAGAERRMFE